MIDEQLLQNGPHVLIQIASQLTQLEYIGEDDDRQQDLQLHADVESILTIRSAPNQDEKLHTLKEMSFKLCEIFDIPAQEFQTVNSCWIVKGSVIVKGHLFYTEHNVCFLAQLPKQTGAMNKEGFLMKKGKNTTQYTSQWCVLKDDMLTYFDSKKDLYFPLGNIDLKNAIAVEPMHNQSHGFKVILPDRRYYFVADTEQSMNEWMHILEACLFRARNDGDVLKVVLPYSSIAQLQLVDSNLFGDCIILSCSDAAALEQYESLDLLAVKNPELAGQSQRFASVSDVLPSQSNAEDFCFAYFSDCKRAFDALNEHAQQDGHHQSSQELSPSSNTLSPAPQRRKENRSSLSTAFKMTGKMLSTTALSPIKIGRGAEESVEQQLIKQFPSLFSESNAPVVLHECQAYIIGSVNLLPKLGRLYITQTHILFNSSLVGMRTKAVIPITDILIVEDFAGQVGFWYGIYIALKHGETWLEFHSHESRERCLSLMKQLVQELKQSQTTAADQDQEDDEILNAGQESGLLFKQLATKRIRNGTTISVLLDDIHRLDSKFTAFPGDDSWFAQSPPIVSVNNLGVNTLSKSLKIFCCTIGTRGDVQPFIALCKGLMNYGHSCTIATHEEYRKWVQSHNINFMPISGNPADLMQLCVDNGMFSISFIREATSKFRTWIDDLLLSCWVAMRDADLIIESPVAMAGYHIAEKLQVPYFAAFPMPWSRTSDFPHPFAVSDVHLGVGYNLMTWVLMENVLWKGLQYQINRFRKNVLEIQPLSSGSWLDEERVPFLYSFSDQVVRQPRDWNSWITLCGYWFLDQAHADWSPPKELIDFIDGSRSAGKPLVYIGFGSVIVQDPAELTRSIFAAVERAGVRAVISKGWSARSVEDSPVDDSVQQEQQNPNVHFLSHVPHDWLFPQVDAVVHHGGAGTTAAGLRAGKPTIIKPFFGDQYFWASRVTAQGVGMLLKKFDPDVMADCLRKVTTDDRMKTKANILGEKISAQDGVGKAIETINRQYPLLIQKIQQRKQRNQSFVKVQDEAQNLTNTVVEVISNKLSALKKMTASEKHEATPSSNLSDDKERRRSHLPDSARFSAPPLSSQENQDGYFSDSQVPYNEKFVARPNKLIRKPQQRRARNSISEIPSSEEVKSEKSAWLSTKIIPWRTSTPQPYKQQSQQDLQDRSSSSARKLLKQLTGQKITQSESDLSPTNESHPLKTDSVTVSLDKLSNESQQARHQQRVSESSPVSTSPKKSVLTRLNPWSKEEGK